MCLNCYIMNFKHMESRNTEDGATDHRAGEDKQAAPKRAFGDQFTQVVADEGPDHKHLGMGEIDEAQDSVNHRVAERDKRIDGTEGETVEKLLEEFGHVKTEERRAEGLEKESNQSPSES